MTPDISQKACLGGSVTRFAQTYSPRHTYFSQSIRYTPDAQTQAALQFLVAFDFPDSDVCRTDNLTNREAKMVRAV